MVTTNQEELKYKTWVMTVNTLESGYLPTQEELLVFLDENCQEYVFQLESGEETDTLHYQCAYKLNIRKRKSTLLHLLEKYFPGNVAAFQLEVAYGAWDEAVKYCTKGETRRGVPISSFPLYSNADIAFLVDKGSRFPWQNDLINEIVVPSGMHFKAADDRRIFWITDKQGCTGKSKFTKFMCLYYRNTIKVPFGTSTQMRSAIIDAGPQQLYFIDIPRTLGHDDDMQALYSLIEDLKNGFVVSSMYGKNRRIMFDPPHIIVFTNRNCPRESLSSDRWIEKEITKDKEFIEPNPYAVFWPKKEDLKDASSNKAN
jgi:hypothetical protein